MLELKEMDAGVEAASGRELAGSPRPMTGVKLLLSRMNGFVLSLLLHGGVALAACLSVFSVQLGGGSGHGSGGSMGTGPIAESYAATVRSGDEQTISGRVLPDVPLYPRLSSEETALDPVPEELPTPRTPVDIFSVGS